MSIPVDETVFALIGSREPIRHTSPHAKSGAPRGLACPLITECVGLQSAMLRQHPAHAPLRSGGATYPAYAR